ncbi:MAG: ABC transporter permease [Spirochaetaceae bacterium]|nr:ABC transporter permease [Spirochaetaceae bacterium]
MNYRFYKTSITMLIILIFSAMTVYAEPLMPPQTSSSGNEMRLYSEFEVDTLIAELTEAAEEAIDKAAGEAARVATLAGLEREAAALAREKAALERERLALDLAGDWQKKFAFEKKEKIKISIITGVVSFAIGALVGGVVIGISF